MNGVRLIQRLQVELARQSCTTADGTFVLVIHPDDLTEIAQYLGVPGDLGGTYRWKFDDGPTMTMLLGMQVFASFEMKQGRFAVGKKAEFT